MVLQQLTSTDRNFRRSMEKRAERSPVRWRSTPISCSSTSLPHGLHAIASARLDELILDLRDGLGATIIIVSHELPSLFTIADDGIYLDNVTKTPIAHGSPSYFQDHCDNRRWPAIIQHLLLQHSLTGETGHSHVRRFKLQA